MRGFLRSLAAQGRAVLVSSHLMSELEDTADHLVVAGRGKAIADTSVADLIAAASGNRVALRTTARPDAMSGPRAAGRWRRGHRPGLHHRLRPSFGTIVTLLSRERGPVLRGISAPRHPGGGVHGAHPRRGRVPRRAARGGAAVTPVVAPYRSGQRAGRDGFPQLLRAEWTKFRTVRGWVAGMVAAALMVVLFAVLAGISSDQHGRPTVPIGPGGEPVTDSFYFVHRPLAGNGSVTVSVSALTDKQHRAVGEGRAHHQGRAPARDRPTRRSWSPAATACGCSTTTPRHGRAPRPCLRRVARWLRLDRSGDAVTGYDSADGYALDQGGHRARGRARTGRARRAVRRISGFGAGLWHGHQRGHGRLREPRYPGELAWW